MEERDGTLYSLLADILEYPNSRILEQARVCRDALENRNRQSGKLLSSFVEFCGTSTLGRREELYTDTFDIEAVCCPYVGFHLFGEDRARGMFMAKLKEHYRAQNYPLDGELPDHICVMLRFLAGADANDETRDLTSYCLIPALRKMVALFKDKENPYQGVLQTVLASLETEGNG